MSEKIIKFKGQAENCPNNLEKFIKNQKITIFPLEEGILISTDKYRIKLQNFEVLNVNEHDVEIQGKEGATIKIAVG